MPSGSETVTIGSCDENRNAADPASHDARTEIADG